METKNEMRQQTSVAQLQENFKEVMANVTEAITERKYQAFSVKYTDGIKEAVDHVEYLTPNLDHLSQTGRKKLAKRLYFASQTKNQKSLNELFWYLKLTKVITEKIHFELSDKEKAIKKSRAAFIEARAKFNEALKAYKDEKGDFYKS